MLMSGSQGLLSVASVGFTTLRSLVETNEVVGIMGSLPEDLAGWEVLHIDQVRQLIYEDVETVTRVKAVVLLRSTKLA